MNSELYQDHISQGISLMTSENYEAAKKEFENALKLDNKSIEAYTHLGNACANLELYDEALTAFKNCLLIDPSSAETLFSIGNIYLLKEEKLKAVEYYNKAEEKGYKTADMYRILAGIFCDVEDVVQALRNISKAISLEPLNGELRFFKARIYLAYGKYNEALETLDDMQKVLPDAFEAYDLRAQIYCALGNFEEALQVAEMGYTRFPDDPNVALSKLNVLIKMNDEEGALGFIEEMKTKDLYNAVIKEASIQESVIYLRKQDIEKPLVILRKANIALKGDPDILYLIMDIYAKTEDYEKTLEAAEMLLKFETGDFYMATAKYFRAHCMDKLGRTEEASAEYKKLTSSLRKMTINTPSFYEGYIYRLLSHTRLGEYDKALDLADYLENVNPEKADSHMFRYFIYKEQGDKENADKEKALAIKMNPDVTL